MCSFCDQPAIGEFQSIRWCVAHQQRGDLLRRGHALKYPDMHCMPYSIGPGAFCWRIACTQGSDEMIACALDAVMARQGKEAI